MHLQVQKYCNLAGIFATSKQEFSVCDPQRRQLPLWCTYKQRGHSVDAVSPAAPLSLHEAAVKRTSNTDILKSTTNLNDFTGEKENGAGAHLVKRVEVPLPLLLLDHPGLKQERQIIAEIRVYILGTCIMFSQDFPGLDDDRSERHFLTDGMAESQVSSQKVLHISMSKHFIFRVCSHLKVCKKKNAAFYLCAQNFTPSINTILLV